MQPELPTLLQEHTSLTIAYARALHSDEAQLRHLLQADLRHQRLLHHLVQAGLAPDPYYLDLHLVLFPLLGFSPAQQESNELHHFYFHLLQGYLKLPLPTYLAQLPEIVQEVLSALREWKEQNTGLGLRYEKLPF